MPVERGGGIEQPNLQVLAKHIGSSGGWLHVFPEGRISYDGKLADLRWGIGRMVCDSMRYGDGRCGCTPTVCPGVCCDRQVASNVTFGLTGHCGSQLRPQWREAGVRICALSIGSATLRNSWLIDLLRAEHQWCYPTTTVAWVR